MSFRLKTILGVALIEAVLLGILLFSGLRMLSFTAEAEFVQRTRATALAFSAATKNALIASDLAGLNALTAQMLGFPGVRFARVRDPAGTVLSSAGDAEALARPPREDKDIAAAAADGIFQAGITVREAGADFGRVELGIAATELQAQGDAARRNGLSLALLEMALVALFSWLLGSYLTRQLVALREASRSIADGALGTQVPVRGRDELAQTAIAFNDMSARLDASYAALHAREAGLRRVLENIQDGIVELSPDGVPVSASAAAQRILGRDEATLVGRPIAGWLDPQSVPAAAQALAQAAAGQAVLRELRALDPAGQPIPIEAQFSPIADAQPPAVLMVLRDIGARVAAKAALNLRGRIIDTSSQAVVIADARAPDLPVTFVNAAFERITGYTAAEVLGRNCRFLQGPETDRAEVDRLRQALATATEVLVLLRNYTKAGRPFWNELQLLPIRDEAGTLTHFVALQNDVTARIEAERALAAREADLRRVVDATHDGIIVTDVQGRIQAFNRGAQQMFGWTADEVIGRDVSLIVAEPHRSRHGDYMLRYLTGGESRVLGVEREFEAQRKDGSQAWIALRVAELEGGPQRRFLGVIHDITERKRGEIDLRRAKDAAEAAATAKSDFLANMSHEIRTPLHGVLGAMEMLSDTPLTGQQERFIETARTSANMLLGVIDEILDFSRLEAGKLRIESLEFDLRRTVEDVTAVLAQRAHAKRVELACYIAPEVPETMVGDPIRLRQVLVNLVGNAIKFTDHGEVVVTCGLLRADEQPDRLRFEVRDTGMGIPPDKRERLFQPFTQADSSTSRRYGGSGLGLSISRRLVELMAGQIDFDSVEGKGSRFWFTLPLPSADRRVRPLRMAALAGARVLVVDDNATNRIILHRYLTSWSAQSGSASAGEEALAKLQDAALSGHPYDIALLDLNMPGMDGYALVRAIREDPALAAMPLVMLSSSVQDPSRMPGLHVDVWLDKPVRQSDLHDAIGTLLGTRSGRVADGGTPRDRQPTFAGERVLLVEDNAVTRELGTQMLRKRGLTVDTAETGHEAVAAVQRSRYDVVLMDIQMPGMDGYQATQVIRRWEAETGRVRLPIIALTAHALPADRERCLAEGMDDYLVKPYNAAMLGTAIARWLLPPGMAGRPGTAPLPPLDAERMAEVRQVMGDDFAALADKAAAAITQQLGEVAQAVGDGQAARAREAMHRVKNTAGDIGARRLHELAAELERSLDAGILPGAELAQLLAEAEAAKQALATLAATPSPPTAPT